MKVTCEGSAQVRCRAGEAGSTAKKSSAYLKEDTALSASTKKALEGTADFSDVVVALAVEVFLESLAGRTFKMLAGKDVHRFMKAGPGAYGFALEDGAKREYVYLAERAAEITFVADVLGPCHHCGEIDSALALRSGSIRARCNRSPTCAGCR